MGDELVAVNGFSGQPQEMMAEMIKKQVCTERVGLGPPPPTVPPPDRLRSESHNPSEAAGGTDRLGSREVPTLGDASTLQRGPIGQ